MDYLGYKIFKSFLILTNIKLNIKIYKKDLLTNFLNLLVLQILTSGKMK